MHHLLEVSPKIHRHWRKDGTEIERMRIIHRAKFVLAAWKGRAEALGDSSEGDQIITRQSLMICAPIVDPNEASCLLTLLLVSASSGSLSIGQ